MMEFRIADTFTDSLARLGSEEQKAVKMTAFDLQMNPVSTSIQLHRVDRSPDPNFWSARVSQDLRLIVHTTGDSMLLCYVDHHEPAYRWARRRKLETHPRTGAAQLVELRETVQEILVPRYVEVERPAPPKPPLFAHLADDELLVYGVPVEWLADVRAADEDTVLDVASHLPAEAAEALLQLATGGRPQASRSAAPDASPFDHPDAQRRFRAMRDVEELERALDYPWDRWTVFLHPDQRQMVESEYAGPARVSGSAGTGKTVVALHRAVFLARSNPESRVLLATFSEALANALRVKLRRLIAGEPRLGERLEVHSMNAIGERLYASQFGAPRIAASETILELLGAAAAEAGEQKFGPRFLMSEWQEVVDAWQLDSWDAYRDVRRLGRRTRLAEAQRSRLWSVFDAVRAGLDARGLVTHSAMFSRLAARLAASGRPTFDFVVIDEAQDVDVAELRFLAALGGGRPNSLFFAGDLGQRIFQQPFSWKALGVDIRGRSKTLHVNYRTSHQIRAQADRLLGPEISDVDGNPENRGGTVSVFNGPLPVILVLEGPEAEAAAVGSWIRDRANEGVVPHEIGVFVRSAAQMGRARAAVEAAGLPFTVLDDRVDTPSGRVSIGTMHLAKGLEFRAGVVMACDDEVLPLQGRIETVTEDSDLQEVYDTERHLLYVACTRARDHLLVTSADPPSEFLDDLRS